MYLSEQHNWYIDLVQGCW